MNRTRTALAAIGLALISAPAFADVKSGVDAYERGDYVQAIAIWRPLAIAGDADAQFNLAQAYRLGRGTPADPKLAEIWFQKAADQGHVQARDAYGLQLFQNGNQNAAMPFIEESASRGEPRAQYVYATALFNGDLVKKDWVRAYAMMTRASAAGISAASTSLAQMDKFIPLDQRQRGLALAGAMENYQRQQTALPTAPLVSDAPATNKPAASSAPPPVQVTVVTPTSIPPSQPQPLATASKPKPTPKPVAIAAVAAVPKPAPKPIAAPSVGGNWRVQLGAFSNSTGANALWTSLRAKIPALAPYRSYVVPAGAVTRLQAGPLPGRAAADTLCASVKAKGNACLPVAP